MYDQVLRENGHRSWESVPGTWFCWSRTIVDRTGARFGLWGNGRVDRRARDSVGACFDATPLGSSRRPSRFWRRSRAGNPALRPQGRAPATPTARTARSATLPCRAPRRRASTRACARGAATRISAVRRELAARNPTEARTGARQALRAAPASSRPRHPRPRPPPRRPRARPAGRGEAAPRVSRRTQ
jgi:hypothetical protein